MKTAAVKFESNLAGPFRSLFAITVGSVRGWDYWRAAEEDEKNGFPFTAALEWQEAAECFDWIALLSNRCWGQWERIMHLPRQLSKPIGESEEFVPQCVMAAPDTGANANGMESLVPVALAA
jgi:hypothetical protein